MIIVRKWTLFMRSLALGLALRQALSFRHLPIVPHRHPSLARASLSPSTATSSPCFVGRFVSEQSKSSTRNGILLPWPSGLLRSAGQGHRPKQERGLLEQQVVVMLAAAGEGVTGQELGGGKGDAGAVDVDVAAARAPSSRQSAEQVHPSAASTPPAPAADPAKASRRRRQEQQYDSNFLFEQKLESVRAALLCGAVGAGSRLLGVGVGALVPGGLLRDLVAAPEPAASSLLFCLAAGFVQGALFGLTYRYVVRSDREGSNAASSKKGADRDVTAPQMDGFTVGHLGDGCVAAFALTSALGQSEVPLTLAAGEFVGVLERGGGIVQALAAVLLPAAPFLPRAAGDLFMYSATRAAIDRALDQGAIKPFP